MNMLPLSHIRAEFVLDGETYEVEEFKTEFRQPVDYKRQPQHEIMGGQIMLTLSQAADRGLYLWAKNSTMLKDGLIRFQTDMGVTIMKITFSKAYCIQMLRETATDAGTKTNLVISPESVSLNGVEHTNKWAT